MRNSLIWSCALYLLICLPGIALAHSENLQLQWQTDGLQNPESVVYDEQRDVLYVSNVNGKPTAKDGNGSIARVSLDGDILSPEWVTGLNAPKGLAIHGDRLYVADIDTLVVIDIANGSISKRYTVSDAKFLNDVTTASNGDVYVSDMMLDRIHRLQDGNFTIWLEDPALENPNGLLAQDERLVVGAWGVMTDGFATETPGHLKSVSYEDKHIRSIGSGEPVGNLDGVEMDADGDFYVTDWMAGLLLHINPAGEAKTLLELNQGSADLEYIPAKDLLLIPMMNDNKLLAYRAHGG